MPNQLEQEVENRPERPKSRISARPMTKGGVMIGSTVSSAHGALAGQAGAQDQQRAGEAEQRGDHAGQHRQDQRVPGDAAIGCWRPGSRVPRCLGLMKRFRRTPRAPARHRNRRARLAGSRHGRKMNRPISSTTMPIEDVVKRSPRHDAAIGQAMAEQEQQRPMVRQRAETHAGLGGAGPAEQSRRASRLPWPLSVTAKALGKRGRRARRIRSRLAPKPDRRFVRDCTRTAARPGARFRPAQPGSATLESERSARCRPCRTDKPRTASRKAGKAHPLGKIPGDERIAEPAGHSAEPTVADASPLVLRRGSVMRLLRQRLDLLVPFAEQPDLRSAEEPYLTKS
jgi:hypothetical protein